MSKSQIIAKSIGISIAVLLLVGAVVAGVRMTPSDTPCRSLSYTICDADERLYLTENELDNMLMTQGLYPVGKHLRRGDLNRIERTITHHPMVRHAECYLTPWHEMRVRLTQRVPVLRVQTPAERYIIDSDRRVMPTRPAVKDEVLRVTGNVGVRQAAGELADFAIWLNDHPYWQERIAQLYIESPFAIYLCLQHEPITERVLLGRMSGFEHKLAKLRTFLEDGKEETAGKYYRELDIRFRGQVIGRK